LPAAHSACTSAGVLGPLRDDARSARATSRAHDSRRRRARRRQCRDASRRATIKTPLEFDQICAGVLPPTTAEVGAHA